jgi:hypothetical protein
LPKITTPQFSKSNGLNATSDEENADILKNHFQAFFDRRYAATTDETVILDEIEELDISGDLKEELRSISNRDRRSENEINKMKRETSPGIMILTSAMIKVLPRKALENTTRPRPRPMTPTIGGAFA